MAREFDLRRARVFQGMTPEQMAALANVGRRELFRPGETVFSGQLRAGSLFVLGSGEVDIQRREPDGTQVTVASLRPGTSFGEAAMFDGHSRYGLGVARGTVACWVLDAAGLDRLRRESPGAARRLLVNLGRAMAWRLERATDQLNAVADGTGVPPAQGGEGRSFWDRLLGRR